jgi:hypothetical protein
MYLSGLAGANSGEVTDVRFAAIADIASIEPPRSRNPSFAG